MVSFFFYFVFYEIRDFLTGCSLKDSLQNLVINI